MRARSHADTDRVCVFDSEYPFPFKLAREQVIEQRGPESPQMQRACGRWSETQQRFHRHVSPYAAYGTAERAQLGRLVESQRYGGVEGAKK